jgi:predicted nucleic acid-binding protein
MKFVDANVFIRLLAEDDKRKSEAAFRLFKRVENGEESLATSEVVLSEIVYVLASKSLYNQSPEEIAARLVPIFSLRGLEVPYKRTCLRALQLYGSAGSFGFQDALSVAHMERRNISEIVSYDRDFDALPGIKRVEP